MLRRILNEHQKKGNCSWFVGVEKRAVLTEVMSFGDPHLDKRRCLQVIKKLLYILNQGQTFTKTEAATVLVSVTNVFMFKDIHLRRLVYLIAKELCPIADADEVEIVTKSLLKDINSSNITYRANVISLLCRITNVTSSTQSEEYLKEAIVDENPVVSSVALVCALHLLKRDPGMGNRVRKHAGRVVWTYKKNKLVTFHALCIILVIQQNHILGVEKQSGGIISFRELKYCTKSILGCFGSCLLTRYLSQVSRGASDASEKIYPGYYKYLMSIIDKKEETNAMVEIEVLHSIKVLGNINIGSGAAKAAMRRGCIYFSSPDRVIRFAAFRAVHELGMAYELSLWSYRVPPSLRLLSFFRAFRFLLHDDNFKSCYLGGMFTGGYHFPVTDAATKVLKAQTKAPAADNLRRRRR